MNEAEKRAEILAEARSWEGTPFHHEACVKGVGVDCAMLPIAVYSSVGLIEKFRPEHYPPDWMLHRADEIYMGWVEKFCRRVEDHEARPGDFVLWKYGHCFAHGMIIIDWPLCIHAQWRSKVERIDVSIDARFIGREHRVYTSKKFGAG